MSCLACLHTYSGHNVFFVLGKDSSYLVIMGCVGGGRDLDIEKRMLRVEGEMCERYGEKIGVDMERMWREI